MEAFLGIPQPYDDLAHTADLGVRVRGADAPQTLARLIVVFGRLLAGRDDAGAPLDSAILEVEGGDPALAAVDVLREVLWRFASERRIPVAARTTIWGAARIAVEVREAAWDAERHRDGVDVKAVTLHGARFEREGDGWVSEVVFDV